MLLNGSFKSLSWKRFSIFLVAGLATAVISHPAWAGGQTLGGLITNTFASTNEVPGLFTAASYLFGLVLGFLGILKLKNHVEQPSQVSIWDSIKRFLAGGAFFVLPYMAAVVQNTINGGSQNQDIITGSDFNTGGASGDGLDAKLVALMRDIWEPMQFIMIGFCYLAGIILIMIGISRILKSEQEGARGPMGFGTIMTFLIAGVLLSLNTTLGAAVNSVFQSGAMNNAQLTYTAGMDGAAVGHANAVIGAIMAFVAIIGWISFIRGFFIMRGVAEGSSQASAMAGITHIIGGAVAVNLGGFLSAIQSTLGITQYGLTIGSVEPYLTTVTFFA
jgi:hypothetical protein